MFQLKILDYFSDRQNFFAVGRQNPKSIIDSIKNSPHLANNSWVLLSKNSSCLNWETYKG